MAPTVTVDLTFLLKAPDSDESSPSPPEYNEYNRLSVRASSIATTATITSVPVGGLPFYYTSEPQGPGLVPTGSSSKKRSMSPHASESPARRQSKWSTEEDALIIELRGSGLKWDDISKKLPGRSAISCRLHYQNYLEKRSEWDEERKNKLARLYERFKSEMWAKVAEEMSMPWRAAEAMHWQLGEQDMRRRAGVTVPFALATSTSEGPRGSSRAHSRHNHSHSQGNLSRDAGPGRGYGRAGTAPPGRPLASRRESVPPRVPIYPEQSPDNFVYPHHGVPLAPIQTQNQPPRPAMLPGVAELTTGISPYSTPAYSLPPPNTSPALSAASSPNGLYMTPLGYPPLESTGPKRRRGSEINSLSPELNRRRHHHHHLDQRPEPYDITNIPRHERGH